MDWRKQIRTENQDLSATPLFEGRPDRYQIINDEDIMNLKILLNTETDFDTFLSKI